MKQHTFTKFIQREEGFSLIEMALVLAIAGIMLGITLPFLLNQSRTHKIILTRERQEALMRALAGYVLKTGTLPAPILPDGSLLVRPGELLEKPGIVPCHVLGLPEIFARDGWGRYFTYAIEPHLFEAAQQGDDFIVDQHISAKFHSYCALNLSREGKESTHLRIMTAKGEIFPSAPWESSLSDFPVVILVSHGETGHGALLETGDRLVRDHYSEAEAQNAAEDLTFFDLPYSTSATATFRNLISWASRDSLVAVYGNSPCSIHQKLLSPPKEDGF